MWVLLGVDGLTTADPKAPGLWRVQGSALALLFQIATNETVNIGQYLQPLYK
jgi:hypothetical protein